MEARRAETLPSVAREGQRLGVRQPGWRTVPEGVRLVRARVQLRPPASLAATTAAFFWFIRHPARNRPLHLHLRNRRRGIGSNFLGLATQRFAG